MISHKKLANWYAQLGQHVEAGTLLADALRLSGGPSAKDRETMADRIQGGVPFEDVLRDAPKWLPRADRFFLIAAMETGNLPHTLQNLSDRHSRVGATKAKVVLGMLYPMGVFHITALLIPITRMIDFEVGFQWDPIRYTIQALTLLIPVWCIIVLVWYLAQSDHPLLPRLLRCIPMLKKYSEKQALADLSYALGTFIAAGVPAPSAWRLSCRIVNDERFNQAFKKMAPTFADGYEPGEQLRRFKCFPPDFRAFYSTGVQSGKLDSNLIYCGRQYQQEANTAMTVASIVYPTLIFAIIAGFIIATIFKVYGSYLDIFNQFQ